MNIPVLVIFLNYFSALSFSTWFFSNVMIVHVVPGTKGNNHLKYHLKIPFLFSFSGRRVVKIIKERSVLVLFSKC